MKNFKYKYNLDFFKQDSEELYYFLGFIAADGYLSNEAIEIGLNSKDKEILDKFKELIVPEKPLYYKEKTDAYILKISLVDINNQIKKFFSMSTNDKAYELRFPNIPILYLKDFIRGYIDGDGCIDTTKAYRGNKIYVGPRLRILGNYEFLKELNERTKFLVQHNTNAITKKGKENIYYVTYNFKTAKELLSILYEDSKIALSRKKQKAIELTI